jgi:hypothetical protein
MEPNPALIVNTIGCGIGKATMAASGEQGDDVAFNVPFDGSLALSDVSSEWLIIECAQCGCSTSYSVGALMADRGDLQLANLLDEIAVTCQAQPGRGGQVRCKALFRT